MLIPPDSVIIKKRVRKDLGDIEALMQSLKEYGQLYPIIINRDYELIAGYRRLEAAKRLGWQSINAVILNESSELQKLEIELEENVQRLNLSAEELAEAMGRLERLRRPGFFRRLWGFLVRVFRAIFRKRRSG